MNEMKFGFSEATVKERKKRILYMMIGMPVVMVLFMVVFMMRGGNSLDLGLFLAISLGASAFMILELYIVSRMMIKRIKQQELIFNDEGFVRSGGKSREEVAFADIDNLFVRRDYKNEIMFIRCKYSRKQLLISGFEDMEEILTLLMAKVSNVSGKQYKWDWNSPLAFFGIFFGTSLLLFGLISMGGQVHEYFNLILTVGVSLYFIIFKPISSSAGKRFRVFEIICGGLMLLGSAGTIIGLFY